MKRRQRRLAWPGLFFLALMTACSGTPCTQQSTIDPPDTDQSSTAQSSTDQLELDTVADDWIVHTVVAGDMFYALYEPQTNKSLPETAQHIPLMGAFAQMFSEESQPLPQPQPLTLIGRDETCTVEATHKTNVFLGCRPDIDSPSRNSTQRKALVGKACSKLAQPEEEWTFAWAIKGLSPNLTTNKIGRLDPADQATQDRSKAAKILIQSYVQAKSLGKQLGPEWDIGAIYRFDGLDSDFVNAGFERTYLSFLLRDGVVIEHYVPGLSPNRLFEKNGATYLEMFTTSESRNMFVIRDGSLHHINPDGLYLFCGDGMY